MAVLEGWDIISLSFADWNASWGTPHQVVTRLAPHNRILFVDQPRSFLYRLRSRERRGAGLWSGPHLQEAKENLFVYHSPHAFLPMGSLPFRLGRQNLLANGKAIARLVRGQARRLGFSKPLLWNFSPLHGGAVPHLERRLSLYDVCDEWASFVQSPSGRRVIEWIDQRLCREADLVFTGTVETCERRRHLNEEIHVAPNGVDYAHFACAAASATVVPAELAELRKPVIGSIGVLDPARFDAALVHFLASQRPDWSFVLIGPIRQGVDLRDLKGLRNVHFLGNRAVADLPAYLKGIDVTLIPYKMNEATRSINPLKLLEYLAGGKPVVAPPIPSVLMYRDVVTIAPTPEDFLGGIEEALHSDCAARQDARQAIARNSTWDMHVTEKTRHVLRLLESGR